jgi:hypothetical protein
MRAQALAAQRAFQDGIRNLVVAELPVREIDAQNPVEKPFHAPLPPRAYQAAR